SAPVLLNLSLNVGNGSGTASPGGVGHNLSTPSYPPAGAFNPRNAPTVGATSTVCAWCGSTALRTPACPPLMKNGIGAVAGWPWLPGIGLDTWLGSENRQPDLQ